MSHFDFVRPSGQWPNEFVPGVADFRRLDVAQFKSINAVAGGRWTPLAPICIGGAGLTSTSGGTSFTGGARIERGAPLIQGSGDVTQLSPARTRSLVMPLYEAPIDPVELVVSTTAGGSTYTSFLDNYISVQLPTATSPGGIVLTNVLACQLAIPSRYLHFLGTSSLNSVTLTFRFLARPTAVPSPMSVSVIGFAIRGASAGTPILQRPAFNASPWAASTPYTAGTYVQPFANFTNAPPVSYFKLLGASGTSGSTEPTWNTTPGSNTTDGPLTWRCIGPSGVIYAPTLDAYYGGGASQSITCAYDVGPFGTGDTLDNTQFRYSLLISAPPVDGSILLHSATFNFVNITSMDFE